MEGSVKLKMSISQMEQEILFMRDWDDFLYRALGEEHHKMLAEAFAEEHGRALLKALGATDEEIEESIRYAREGGTEH